MGCPASSSLIYGVVTDICEEHYYNKVEKYNPKVPDGVDYNYATNHYNDDETTNIIGYHLCGVDNCEAVGEVYELQTKKEERSLVKFLEKIGVDGEPALHLTCHLE